MTLPAYRYGPAGVLVRAPWTSRGATVTEGGRATCYRSHVVRDDAGRPLARLYLRAGENMWPTYRGDIARELADRARWSYDAAAWRLAQVEGRRTAAYWAGRGEGQRDFGGRERK